MSKVPVPVGRQLTSTQEDAWQRIFSLPKEEQTIEVLKWALARLTFYGPSNEPAANAIRVYLGHDQVA